MLSFFSNEFITTTVNLVVVVALLFFLYYILKKFLPSKKGEELKEKIQTSTTSQNILAFLSVIIASTFIDLLADKNWHMIYIVVVISGLTIFFSFLYEKVSNINNELDSKEAYKKGLSLLEQIITCKGYSLIKNASKIGEIENQSDEVYIFTENLATDIGSEMISDEHENKGLFANLVKSNIPFGKKYTYFVKNTQKNRDYLQPYYDFHFASSNKSYINNVSFYFIPENEFLFFSELYLYKDRTKNDVAFEWIPSIGEKGNEDKQFYLQLSSVQTQNINEIMCDIMISYNKESLNQFMERR